MLDNLMFNNMLYFKGKYKGRKFDVIHMFV
jgi:hypothetical protein